MKITNSLILPKALLVIFSFLLFSGNVSAQATPICAGDGSAADLSCGLAAYWNFDNGSQAPTVQDCSSVDANGNCNGSNTATIESGATFTNTAQLIGAGALTLSGTSYHNVLGTNAYVQLPSSLDTPKVTFSIWFSTNSFGVLLSDSNAAPTPNLNPDGSNAPSSYNPFLFVGNDGYLYGGWGNGQLKSASVVNDNQWHLAVIENDGTNQTLYLDGALVGSQTAGAISPLGFLQIGTGYSGNSSNWPALYDTWNYFSGTIDDVRIYGRILQANEVQAIYSNVITAANTSSTCQESDVQNAINITSAGGTVTIRNLQSAGVAGPCTWGTSLVIAKPITLTGCALASDGVTCLPTSSPATIIDGTDKTNQYGNHAVIDLESGGASLTRLTNMIIQGGSELDNYDKGMITVNVKGSQWRVDHLLIHASQSSAMYVYSTGGVIDHNEFDLDGYHAGIFGFASPSDFYGDATWTAGNDLGTANAYFVEDNIFKELQSNVAVWANDGWTGQRVVFRHNTLFNVWWGNHGTDSAGLPRGSRSYEVYDNTFNWTADTDPNSEWGYGQTLYTRSGNGVVFNNTFNGSAFPAPHAIVVENYRDFMDASTIFGACDGTGPFDLNDGVTYYGGTATTASGLDALGQNTVITDTNANWVPNQWVGYSIKNITQPGDGEVILSNTPTTITVADDSSHHVQNGVLAALQFNPGDQYEILRASACLDQTGRGSGLLLSRDSTGKNAIAPNTSWLQQNPEALYAWNNSWNNSSSEVPVKVVSGSPHIVLNRDILQNVCPAGYQEYQYPHRLVSSTPQADDSNCVNYSSLPSTYSITLTKSGYGSGNVGGSQIYTDSSNSLNLTSALISCAGSVCSSPGLTSGSTVILTAAPASGSSFQSWGGACSGSTGPTCTLTMNSNQNVTANFNIGPTVYSFNVSMTNNNGFGQVFSLTNGIADGNINCGVNPSSNNCSERVNAGRAVTLQATAAPGSVFSGWTVNDSPAVTSSAYTINVNAATSVVANFVPQVAPGPTAPTVPGTPTAVTAVAGNGQATVSFAAPASNGGSVITDYTVTSSGGQTASGTSSPVTVTGLTIGTAYTFTVTASNAIGTGLPSAASDSVTPQGPTPAISPDNTTLCSPASTTSCTLSSGNLVTSAGTWNFTSTPFTGGTFTGGYYFNLTQSNATVVQNVGVGDYLLVYNNGQLYAHNTLNSWFLWNGSGWTGLGVGADPRPSAQAVPPALSTDGTTLNDTQGGTVVTNVGTWTFTSTMFTGGTFTGGYYFNLTKSNGTVVQNVGVGDYLLVYNGGQLYAHNTLNNWFLWNGSGWTNLGFNADPRLSAALPISPDNSTLCSPASTTLCSSSLTRLVTSAGTWAFTPTLFTGGSYTGGYYFTLTKSNGTVVQNVGVGDYLLVYNGGQLYAHTTTNNWFLWNGSAWTGLGVGADPRISL